MLKSMNILFIGNSYTYYNDLPAIFEKLANENGKNVMTSSVTFGGARLHQFVEDNEYAKMLDELLEKNQYDICILQEQSILPIVNYTLFLEGIKNLNTKLDGMLKNFILYETWGRKNGSETLEEYGWTNESMTKHLSEAYGKAAKEISAEVAHVGLNFFEVYKKHPEIELYNEDKTHPSYKGSCLAALTFYKNIFGTVPEKTDSLELSEWEKEIMKNTI